jgi:hypothetical protein
MSNEMKQGTDVSTNESTTSTENQKSGFHIDVANETLNYRSVFIDDATPTGKQLSLAAGYRHNQECVVLQVLHSGELEDIRPDEVVQFEKNNNRFVIVESDRTYRFTIDGARFEWPCRIVSGGLIRKLGNIADNHAVYFERQDESDLLIDKHALVDLDAPGTEAFYSKKLIWKLNVQGEIIEVDTPTIVVRHALELAGFDPGKNWQIFLRVQNKPKKEVDLQTVIDLTQPGIEKLRLVPREVNNGEASHIYRREFSLLAVDEIFLQKSGLKWETLVEQDRRWLMIFDYPIPSGYNVEKTTLLLEIPLQYPAAQIDMFYTYPPLSLQSGRVIECTQVRANVYGIEYHGWSRHRGGNSPWDPSTDNVITHLALVESSIAKEVDQ